MIQKRCSIEFGTPG